MNTVSALREQAVKVLGAIQNVMQIGGEVRDVEPFAFGESVMKHTPGEKGKANYTSLDPKLL